MGTFSSRTMEDSGYRSGSEDSSDPDPDSDLATVLQYLIRSGQLHIISSDRDDSDDDIACPPTRTAKPNTEVLDKSEISVFIKQSSGLIQKRGQERPKPIASMVCARERGMFGSTAFTKGDCTKMYNTFLPNKRKTVGSFQTKIFCGTYSKDGNTFLSASQDRMIRLFDTSAEKFKLVKTIAARDVGWSILDTAFSPDGNYIAYSSWSDCLHLCNLWGDTEKAENQQALLLCPDERRFCIFSLTFSSDGREILCGANDGYIYVYDRECNQRALGIDGHEDDVNTVAFADGTSQILYSGGDDGICKVWDRRTLTESQPKPVGSLAGHMDGITFVEPRGDGRHLLTNSKDQSIKLWDVRKFSNSTGLKNTKKAVSSQNWDYRWQKVPKALTNPKKQVEGDTSVMTYNGHSVLQTLCRCHFSPVETTGQRYIYAACAAGRVVVYDVLTGKIEKELSGHRACVRDAAWHPYRSEITSTSFDGNIIRWTYSGKKYLDSDDEEDETASKQDMNVDGDDANKNFGKRKRNEPRRSQRIAERRAKLEERQRNSFSDL